MASRSNVEGARLAGNLMMEGNKLGVTFQTLGGTLTMDADLPPFVSLDPGGASRTVLLPPEAKGLIFYIANLADAAETLTVKEDSNTTTIGVVEQGAVGIFICAANAAGGAATPTWIDITGSATEGFYVGLTAGTAAASKALVLGASKEIATITTATITNLNSTTIAAAGKVSSSSPSTGVGYATGAGGTGTQATNRTTTVTMSPAGCMSGTITTHNASLAAEVAAAFTVSNSSVEIGDTIILAQRSGSNGGSTKVYVSAVAAGSFQITVANDNAAGGTAETGAIIINFAVIKAVAA